MRNFIETLKNELRSLETSDSALRKFGFIVGGTLLLLAGGLHIFLDKELHMTIPLLGGALVVFALFHPRSLLWPYYAWMSLAVILSFLVGPIILTILFFLVVSPLAMVRRFFRGNKGVQKASWVSITGLQPMEKMDRLF